MSFSVNDVTFGGTVGAEPTLNKVGERMVCEFPVAMNESWKGKDGTEQTHTEWVTVKVWDNDRSKPGTNSSKVLAKGDRVLVQGRRRTRSWETDGVKHYKVECIASKVHWIEKKKDDNSDPNSF
jgi:single-strand DNA-binding protein